MKEAFEKIRKRIGKLYGETPPIAIINPRIEDVKESNAYLKCLEIVREVEAEYMKNPVYQYAMMYAKNLVLFGVDVRENLDSAVAQSMALNQAYIKGVDDERKRMYEAEFGKDINALGNGWIPCSERFPEKYGRYLVCNDGVAWIADFFNSAWFGKRCRYSDVIAWMPLPEPYKPEK